MNILYPKIRLAWMPVMLGYGVIGALLAGLYGTRLFVRGELPGLARQRDEYVLGYLLRRAGGFEFAQRGGIDEVQVPAHDIGEGRLITLPDERPKQPAVLMPLIHLLTIKAAANRLNRKEFLR